MEIYFTVTSGQSELETLISPYSSVVCDYWRSEEVKLVFEKKISKVN